MEGSKRARVGILLYGAESTYSPASLFVKIFDTTISLYRFVLFPQLYIYFFLEYIEMRNCIAACFSNSDRYLCCFSYKEKVLDFLEELCSFYEGRYMTVPLLDSENFGIFSDMVHELAEKFGFPFDHYNATFSNFSVAETKMQNEKVLLH